MKQKKNENSFIMFTVVILLSSCSLSRFSAGVDITFDPETIGMQIDDTIMQKI